MNSAECLLIIGMVRRLSYEVEEYGFINRETGEKVIKSEIVDSFISSIVETLDEIYEDIKV